MVFSIYPYSITQESFFSHYVAPGDGGGGTEWAVALLPLGRSMVSPLFTLEVPMVTRCCPWSPVVWPCTSLKIQFNVGESCVAAVYILLLFIPGSLGAADKGKVIVPHPLQVG